MSGRAQSIAVEPDEADSRLDRWLKRRFPDAGHARIQKWLRTGQVRVDGRRAKPGVKLVAGQVVRLPPQASEPAPGKPNPRPRPIVDPADAAELRSRVIYQDDEVLILDKPAGLAVQGGSKLRRNLDAMLDALQFDAVERPRLVHRLDKDTSGVLVLARTVGAAAFLTKAFRTGDIRKIYWAIVVGAPKPVQGTIDLPLAKKPVNGRERMAPSRDTGKAARTDYRVVDTARKLTWLALEPWTGRTHQLRAHCAALGTPILGDGKYGGAAAFVTGMDMGRGLHLLARSIRLRLPSGSDLEIEASLPDHMGKTWSLLGFGRSDSATTRANRR
jgi:23S rRNA pseudouridine955/2504/2580 synthase